MSHYAVPRDSLPSYPPRLSSYLSSATARPAVRHPRSLPSMPRIPLAWTLAAAAAALGGLLAMRSTGAGLDRKSTRLYSSLLVNSYTELCLNNYTYLKLVLQHET